MEKIQSSSVSSLNFSSNLNTKQTPNNGVSVPEQIKDGDKKLNTALACLGILAAAGIGIALYATGRGNKAQKVSQEVVNNVVEATNKPSSAKTAQAVGELIQDMPQTNKAQHVAQEVIQDVLENSETAGALQTAAQEVVENNKTAQAIVEEALEQVQEKNTEVAQSVVNETIQNTSKVSREIARNITNEGDFAQRLNYLKEANKISGLGEAVPEIAKAFEELDPKYIEALPDSVIADLLGNSASKDAIVKNLKSLSDEFSSQEIKNITKSSYGKRNLENWILMKDFLRADEVAELQEFFSRVKTTKPLDFSARLDSIRKTKDYMLEFESDEVREAFEKLKPETQEALSDSFISDSLQNVANCKMRAQNLSFLEQEFTADELKKIMQNGYGPGYVHMLIGSYGLETDDMMEIIEALHKIGA